jgi:phytoene/squalene synthetase
VQQGVRTILEVADGYYAAGEAGIGGLDPDSRLAVRAAARIYHGIGSRIRQRDYQVLNERARVSTLGKLRLFALAMLAPAGGDRSTHLDEPARRALATAERLVSACGISIQG